MKINLKMFTVLTTVLVSVPVVFYSESVLGEISNRKNITIVLHPINEADDEIRSSFSEELARLLPSKGYEK